MEGRTRDEGGRAAAAAPPAVNAGGAQHRNRQVHCAHHGAQGGDVHEAGAHGRPVRHAAAGRSPRLRRCASRRVAQRRLGSSVCRRRRRRLPQLCRQPHRAERPEQQRVLRVAEQARRRARRHVEQRQAVGVERDLDGDGDEDGEVVVVGGRRGRARHGVLEREAADERAGDDPRLGLEEDAQHVLRDGGGPRERRPLGRRVAAPLERPSQQPRLPVRSQPHGQRRERRQARDDERALPDEGDVDELPEGEG
mmetsp:Transcript_25142/g.87724  ORF Transcript_25142/g.87724 Transcript_25142/m.87724 type:complete len:252 (+) Transcript_25142:1658-2413(+)